MGVYFAKKLVVNFLLITYHSKREHAVLNAGFKHELKRFGNRTAKCF